MTQVTEVAHLTKIIRTTEPSRSDITALMSFVKMDTSHAFSEAEQEGFMEAASLRLSSVVAGCGQANLHGSHNYYTDEDWSFWEADIAE